MACAPEDVQGQKQKEFRIVSVAQQVPWQDTGRVRVTGRKEVGTVHQKPGLLF